MDSRIGLIIILVVVVALIKGATAAATIVPSTTPYDVGDSLGWTAPPNTTYYSTWATSKTFFLGDSFSFKWNGTHDMAVVSKAEYDNCTKVGLVFGSGIIYTPQSGGLYYFVCTVDNHCDQGQKLAITVQEPNGPNPPVGRASEFPKSSLTVVAFFAVVSIIVIDFFTYI